ncbi:hypothetical protein F2P56_012402 [Juglans regia]|uniref:Reverse transcriptase domain-containing protein n=1 Tax=Juglans regia TaxID=51240 RepID=A0A834CQT4_JUGRE|nr:hypothetical protein F2P56_012402 [Juglans regia]
MPQQEFKPSRDIRHGDPLSPYLFISCAEVLSSRLTHAERQRSISRVPIACGKFSITYLFFVDDSLLFYKANAFKWSRLIHILNLYERASGQKLNKEKTSIQFNRNIRRQVQEMILNIAGVRSFVPYEKYLGLPAMIDRS